MTGSLSLAQLPSGYNGSGQNEAFLAKVYYVFCHFTSVFAHSTVFVDTTVIMCMDIVIDLKLQVRLPIVEGDN